MYPTGKTRPAPMRQQQTKLAAPDEGLGCRVGCGLMTQHRVQKGSKQGQMSKTSAPHWGHVQSRLSRHGERKRASFVRGPKGAQPFGRRQEPSLQGLTLAGEGKMPAEARKPRQIVKTAMRVSHVHPSAAGAPRTGCPWLGTEQSLP